MGILIFLIAAAQAQVTSVSLATTRYGIANTSVSDPRVIGTREANVKWVIGRSNETAFEVVIAGSGAFTIAPQYTGSGCTDGTVATGAHNMIWRNVSSGTAGSTKVYFHVNQNGSTSTTPFDCTMIFTINSTDYTFTFHITPVARNASIQTNFKRIPDSSVSACSVNNTTWEETRGKCLSTNRWPNLSVTSVGSKRVEPESGATIKRVNIGKLPYSHKVYNHDGTLISVKFFPSGGAAGTYDTTDGSLRNAKWGGFYSPNNPNVWYQTGWDLTGSTNSKEIHKFSLSGSTVTETVHYTWSGGANEYIHSNDNSQNAGSWIPYWVHDTGTNDRAAVCIQNTEVTPGGVAGTPICYDYDNYPFGRPDGTPTNGNLAQVSGPDREGRYFLFTAQVYDYANPINVEGTEVAGKIVSMVFFARAGDAELTLIPGVGLNVPKPDNPTGAVSTGVWPLFSGPNGSYFGSGGHSSSGCDGSGECWWVGQTPANAVPTQDSGNYSENPGGFSLTRLADAYEGMSTIQHPGLEAGGFWTRVGTFKQGNYYNFASSVGQVVAMSTQGGTVEGYDVIGATLSSGTLTLTLSTNWGTGYASPSGWTAGVTTVKLYKIGGITGTEDQIFTVTSIAANVIEMSCPSCSGTYTSGGYAIRADSTVSSSVANTDKIMVVRMGGEFGAFHHRLIAMHHSLIPYGQSGAEVFGEGSSAAYIVQYPFASLSGDGKKVIWGDTEGATDVMSNYMADTGFDIDATTPINHFDRHGHGFELDDRVLTLHRTKGHCVVEYSANRDRTSLTTVQMPPGANQTTLTMTNGTKYYVWVTCDNFDVGVKSVTAATLPGSGTANVTVSGRAPAAATQMIVYYGATLGSSTTVACTAGSTCSATVTGNLADGNVRYAVTWARADNFVVKREPPLVARIQ